MWGRGYLHDDVGLGGGYGFAGEMDEGSLWWGSLK